MKFTISINESKNGDLDRHIAEIVKDNSAKVIDISSKSIDATATKEVKKILGTDVMVKSSRTYDGVTFASVVKKRGADTENELGMGFLMTDGTRTVFSKSHKPKLTHLAMMRKREKK